MLLSKASVSHIVFKITTPQSHVSVTMCLNEMCWKMCRKMTVIVKKCHLSLFYISNTAQESILSKCELASTVCHSLTSVRLSSWRNNQYSKSKNKKDGDFQVHDLAVTIMSNPARGLLLQFTLIFFSCFLSLSTVYWGKMPKPDYKDWLTKALQSVCVWIEDRRY